MVGRLLVFFSRARATLLSISAFGKRVVNPPGFSAKNRPYIILAVVVPACLSASNACPSAWEIIADGMGVSPVNGVTSPARLL